MNVDLRGAFWTPSATILGSASKMYDRIVRSIFANGEQGFAYDPNDLTTLFQDTAGTIPVTSKGQPVGLMLDKSKGLVLGGEVLTNNWNLTGQTDWTYADGVLTKVSTTAGGGPSQMNTTSFVAGQLYKIEFEVSNLTGGSLGVMFIGGTNSNVLYAATNGTFTGYLFANAGNNYLRAVATSATARGSIKIQSVKAIYGNHAYQSVSASRPILQQTPILGNELATNGSLTSDATGWYLGGNAYIDSINGAVLNITATTNYPTAVNRVFDVKDGAVYQITAELFGSAASPAKILARKEGFHLINNQTASEAVSSTTHTKVSFLTTGTSTKKLYLSVVVDAANVTSGAFGVRNISVQEITGYRTNQNYLQFDGVDDFLQTNKIDFTATDKVSLFAGVRKLSDSSYATIAELGAADNTLGSFGIGCAGQLGDSLRRTYISNMCGSSKIAHGVYVFAAPTSNVLSTRFDLAKSGAATTVMRVDSLISPKVTENTTTGGGVYGNHPFFIGRRNGSILPFSGNIYSLIGIARLTTDAETLALEKAIAKLTGVTLNV